MRSDFVKSKIQELPELLKRVNLWKLKGEKVVFTNGCFDILHRGHISYLMEAADLGSRLVLALNSDESVKKQGKGDDRPINSQEDRAMLLASLGYVDSIILFDSETPKDIIEALLPDVLVKGGDYNAEQTNANDKDFIVGSDLVKENGGEVKVINLVEGYSTTRFLEKIKTNR